MLSPQAQQEGCDPRAVQSEEDQTHAHCVQDDTPPPHAPRTARGPRGTRTFPPLAHP